MREWIDIVRRARNSCRRRRLICEYYGLPQAQHYAEISQALDEIIFKYSAFAYN